MFGIGDIIDDIKIISFECKNQNWIKYFKVKCEVCGYEKTLSISDINRHIGTKHNNRTCKYIEEMDKNIGLVINDYKIIKRLNRKYKSTPYYLARCNICGLEFETTMGNFKRYGTKHENCTNHLPKDKYLKRFRKIYSCMRYRTTNPKSDKYNFYGGRGISSDYYADFIVFYKELFESYKNHVDKYGENETTLDRIDPNGNYEKGNVRWATRVQQANNTRGNVFFKINNDTKTLSEWCKFYNKDYALVINRVNNLHWNIKKALEI